MGHCLQHCSKAVGFDYLAISLPNPMAKYSRVGYVQFKEDTDLAAAMELLCESKVSHTLSLGASLCRR